MLILNVKALVCTFNKEKALVGAFSVIAQIRRLIVCSSSYIVAVVRGGVLKVVQCALENLIKLQIN